MLKVNNHVLERAPTDQWENKQEFNKKMEMGNAEVIYWTVATDAQETREEMDHLTNSLIVKPEYNQACCYNPILAADM